MALGPVELGILRAAPAEAVSLWEGVYKLDVHESWRIVELN